MEGYERFDGIAFSRAIKTKDGESVLVRTPFRWLLNGRVIPNAYEMFEMDEVCKENGLHVVDRFGDHIAVVTREVES